MCLYGTKLWKNENWWAYDKTAIDTIFCIEEGREWDEEEWGLDLWQLLSFIFGAKEYSRAIHDQELFWKILMIFMSLLKIIAIPQIQEIPIIFKKTASNSQCNMPLGTE